MSTTRRTGVYRCDECGAVYLTNLALRGHLTKHGGKA